MNEANQTTRVLDDARDLAEEVMALHILSVRMGAGGAQPEDYSDGSRIIAAAEALMADIARVKRVVPHGTSA